MSSDDERIAYLAGEPDGELDPSERADLDELRALLADPSLWIEPDPGLEERVVTAVGSVSAEPDAPALRARPPARTPRARSRRVPLVLAGLAAAAAILIGVVLVPANRDGSDTIEVALQATELEPGASGTIRVTEEESGLRIELEASGLPRRDNGEYYQAWLRNEAGELVPVGTFHEGEGVVLWAGVGLEEFSTFTITLERVEADQASSGQRVLVGTIG